MYIYKYVPKKNYFTNIKRKKEHHILFNFAEIFLNKQNS